MKTTLKGKIFEKVINPNMEMLKNKLTMVACDIHHLRKYNKDAERIEESKLKISRFEEKVSVLEQAITIYSSKEFLSSEENRFTSEEELKEHIAEIEQLIKTTKRQIEIESQRLELSSMIDSYETREKELDKDVRELKKMLRFWQFVLKVDELSEEQLLAYNYAMGKIEI